MTKKRKHLKIGFSLSTKIRLIILITALTIILAFSLFISQSPRAVIGFSLFIIVLAILAAYFLYKNISEPIIDLTFKVQEMAAGNLRKKLEVKTNDEIGQLTTALNELMTRLITGVAIDVSKSMEIDQAKTDFVALASHQLRTPLSIIKWYVDFVLGGDAGELTEEQKKYLREVYLSNERLIEMVNALLDVSRIDLGTFAIEPEPANLIKLADSAIECYVKEIKQKKLVIVKKYDQLPDINVDPRLMKIVFQNLFSNSVKYTPENGKILIEIKKTDDYALIKISDSGLGIPKEEQPKIFTKMFRADNIKKIESIGTGLGLYIVKAVIEKSGGKIWFESPSMDLFLENESQPDGSGNEENVGTTFFISIPLKGMKAKAGTKKLTALDK